jgi:hypothetical protein
MDKRITRYSSLKAMKSDEYRSWQRLPGSERIRAVMDLNLDLYAMKGQAAGCTKTSWNRYLFSTPDRLDTRLLADTRFRFMRSHVRQKIWIFGLAQTLKTARP